MGKDLYYHQPVLINGCILDTFMQDFTGTSVLDLIYYTQSEKPNSTAWLFQDVGDGWIPPKRMRVSLKPSMSPPLSLRAKDLPFSNILKWPGLKLYRAIWLWANRHTLAEYLMDILPKVQIYDPYQHQRITKRDNLKQPGLSFLCSEEHMSHGSKSKEDTVWD